MLEKLPHAVGEALSGLKAGLEKIAYHAVFPETPETLAVTSPAFAEGETLPARFTEDGAKVSPPLAWSGVPAEARSVVVLAEDADSPTPKPLVHLIVWNLGRTRCLPDRGGAREPGQPRRAPQPRQEQLSEGPVPAPRSADRARTAPLRLPGLRPRRRPRPRGLARTRRAARRDEGSRPRQGADHRHLRADLTSRRPPSLAAARISVCKRGRDQWRRT